MPGSFRSQLQNLIEAGSVTCNGSLEQKDKLKAGQTILLTLPDPQPIEAQPQNIPLDIVYEDDSLLVVNKPKGMVVHPAPGNPDGTMVNALLWHCAGRLSGIGGAIRPGIVHRIDKDTSGLWSLQNGRRPPGTDRTDERAFYPSGVPRCGVWQPERGYRLCGSPHRPRP